MSRAALLGAIRPHLPEAARSYAGWVLTRGRWNPERQPWACPACGATADLTVFKVSLAADGEMHVVVSCPTCEHFSVQEVG